MFSTQTESDAAQHACVKKILIPVEIKNCELVCLLLFHELLKSFLWDLFHMLEILFGGN
jgi:hypothetical protein